MREPTSLPAARDAANDAAVAAGVGQPASKGPSSLRRDLLLRLRLDGPSSPDQLAERLGASRTGVLQQLRALEAAHLVSRQTVRHGVGRPRHLYDVTRRCPGPLPVELRRPGVRPAGRHRGGRRRRPPRPGLRRAAAPARRPGPRADDRTRRPRRAARRAGPRAGRHPGRPGLPRRRDRSAPTARSGCASTTARSTTSPRARRPRARPSSSCSARSSARTSSASSTSPPAIAAARTGSPSTRRRGALVRRLDTRIARPGSAGAISSGYLPSFTTTGPLSPRSLDSNPSLKTWTSSDRDGGSGLPRQGRRHDRDRPRRDGHAITHDDRRRRSRSRRPRRDRPSLTPGSAMTPPSARWPTVDSTSVPVCQSMIRNGSQVNDTSTMADDLGRDMNVRADRDVRGSGATGSRVGACGRRQGETQSRAPRLRWPLGGGPSTGSGASEALLDDPGRPDMGDPVRTTTSQSGSRYRVRGRSLSSGGGRRARRSARYMETPKTDAEDDRQRDADA